jgi:hypothetical protein
VPAATLPDPPAPAPRAPPTTTGQAHDQGRCGACVAFAVAAAAEAAVAMALRRDAAPLSTSDLYFCAGAGAYRRCQDGWRLEDALQVRAGLGRANVWGGARDAMERGWRLSHAPLLLSEHLSQPGIFACFGGPHAPPSWPPPPRAPRTAGACQPQPGRETLQLPAMAAAGRQTIAGPSQ